MGKHDFCCAVGCAHDRSRGATCNFYTFPVDPHWQSLWVAAVNREVVLPNGRKTSWTPGLESRLCSCHFVNPPCPKSRSAARKHVKPTLFVYKKEVNTRTTRRAINRTSSNNVKAKISNTKVN